jgi:hypothetical protein
MIGTNDWTLVPTVRLLGFTLYPVVSAGRPSRSRPSIALMSYAAREEAPRQTAAITYDLTCIVARTTIC